MKPVPETTSPNIIGGTEAVAQMRELHRRQRDTALHLGFPKLEADLRPCLGQYLVLAAKPGTYKTTVAWTWALNLSMRGLSVCWIGLELPPAVMAEFALARLSGIPRSRFRSQLTLEEQAALTKAESRFEDVCPVLHYDSREIEDVIGTAKRVRYDVIFVDYLQLINAPGKEYERVSHISKALARLTGKGGGYLPDYTPTVICVSQFNRSGIVNQREEDRFPDLTDLKGSSQIEQDADGVVFLHRYAAQQASDTRIYAKVGKNRSGPSGNIVTLNAQPEIAFVEEMP